MASQFLNIFTVISESHGKIESIFTKSQKWFVPLFQNGSDGQDKARNACLYWFGDFLIDYFTIF